MLNSFVLLPGLWSCLNENHYIAQKLFFCLLLVSFIPDAVIFGTVFSATYTGVGGIYILGIIAASFNLILKPISAAIIFLLLKKQGIPIFDGKDEVCSLSLDSWPTSTQTGDEERTNKNLREYSIRTSGHF
ncbi:hypothetical protein HELRODRAFT_170493 [Helobdella robusta]|uniref:Uncharacterized protein n=1 Tax=Helobdella robusta TaxID=6412 RepID=T1F345_HELRO|nr:hypothetical protein HELRODRAFT_170493 [Helobdella robusta]ESO07182.1 hypothetical protein HELRODRAFT_170493 [Helobdella robusta]